MDIKVVVACLIASSVASAVTYAWSRYRTKKLPVEFGHIVHIDYTNWRGERSIRPIEPFDLVYKKSPYHEKKQWFIEAFDVGADKDYDEPKDFALANIHAWIDPDAAESPKT